MKDLLPDTGFSIIDVEGELLGNDRNIVRGRTRDLGLTPNEVYDHLELFRRENSGLVRFRTTIDVRTRLTRRKGGRDPL